MPRHAFRFPSEVRDAVRQHVDRAVQRINPNRFKQEAAYCAALAQALEGVAYDGRAGRVEFRSTVIADRGRGAAEGWTGADLAITAEISDHEKMVTKAILIQAKRGVLEDLPPSELRRLNRQIRTMVRHTRSPKVMDIPFDEREGGPGIYSGKVVIGDKWPMRYSLSNYMVMRVLTTLDGDTRREFVDGVQDSDLTKLKVKARLEQRIEWWVRRR